MQTLWLRFTTAVAAEAVREILVRRGFNKEFMHIKNIAIFKTNIWKFNYLKGAFQDFIKRTNFSINT